MTRQYAGRNNVTISMPDGSSVPMVSQTEIDPMKTALSLMLALATTTALTEPLSAPKRPRPGRELLARVHCKRLILHAAVWRAGDDRQAATCPWGWLASGNYCEPSCR
jgi:hypothetical protein